MLDYETGRKMGETNKTPDKSTFFEKLEQCAANHDIRLTAAALAMGRSRSFISALKSRGSVPTVTTAAAMVKACGGVLCIVDPSEINEHMIIID